MIAPPDHVLARRGAVELAGLAGHKVIAREPMSWPRAMFDRLAAQIDPPPVAAFEFTSSEAVK